MPAAADAAAAYESAFHCKYYTSSRVIIHSNKPEYFYELHRNQAGQSDGKMKIDAEAGPNVYDYYFSIARADRNEDDDDGNNDEVFSFLK